MEQIRAEEFEKNQQMQRQYSEQVIQMQQEAAERQRAYWQEVRNAEQRYRDYVSKIPPPPPDMIYPPLIFYTPPREDYWTWLARTRGTQQERGYGQLGDGRLVLASSLLPQ